MGVDNDAVFESPLKKNRVNLNSLLLTLPQMKYPVTSSIKEDFTHVIPDTFMLEWLAALQVHNEQYKRLFKQLCEEKKRQCYCLGRSIRKKV